MTRRTRNLHGSSAGNSTVRRSHRRTEPRRSFDGCTDEDYQSHSRVSLYDSNDGVSEQPVIDDEDTASYITASRRLRSIPILRSDGFNETVRSPVSAPSLDSYVNIAPLPVFRGFAGECPVAHLSRFAKVCRANNAATIEMIMRIFPVTLEHEAALWYDLNIEPYIESLSWEQIKSAFVEAYRVIKPPDQLRRELTSILQDQDEPVRSYFLRIQRILTGFPDHGLSDPLLKAIFVNGLSEDLRDWVARQMPQSLNEALSFAFGYEKTFGTSQKVPAGDAGSESGSGGSLKKGCRCSKHQCWKKGLEKNYSFLTTGEIPFFNSSFHNLKIKNL